MNIHRLAKKLQQLRRRKGMTLIELAIVILVLGIIIGIVTYGLRDSSGVIDAAKRMEVVQKSTMLKNDWLRYEAEVGELPDGTSLLELTKRDAEHPGWNPLGEKNIMDPWKNPYFICRDEQNEKQICTKGADNKEGGEGKDKDFFLTREDSWPSWLSGKK